MRRVSTNYARALLHLAVARNALVQVHADMHDLQDLCVTNKHFVATLKNPTIPRNKQQTILKQVFQNSEHKLMRSFFAKIVQNRRVSLLPEISRAFMLQYDAYKGIKRGQVIAASPLPDTLMKMLQQIGQSVVPCQQLLLEQRLDPTLMGGYILYVEDKRLDQSLRKQLRRLQAHWVAKGY